MMRAVHHPDGLTTEDGYHLPKGTMLSVIAYPAQIDPDHFEEPNHLDPFRFSRMREQAPTTRVDNAEDATTNGHLANGSSAEEKPSMAASDSSGFGFVSTGPTNLVFGHGRHACPGRFIVDFEFKMMLHYVVSNYDIEFPAEYKGVRPQNYWLAEATFPPKDVKIRIKRRHNREAKGKA